MRRKDIDSSWLKAAVFGANDGIVTTFAIVAGVAGAQLSVHVVLVLGIANMISDGISMALGDYLGEKSERQFKRRIKESYSNKGIWKTGVVTFVSFVIAGTFPLLPYIISGLFVPITFSWLFPLSIFSTGSILLIIGSARAFFTKGSWWKLGLEMLAVGTIAAVAAYVLGSVIERLLLR